MRLYPPCVLAAGFVSLEVIYPKDAFRLDWGNKVMIWFKNQNLKRSLVISHFDGTNFDVITHKPLGPSFLVSRKR